MMAARSQYPMSNNQYPIIKSDPADSFYVLRKSPVGTALRAVRAVRSSPWTLDIGHWILNIPSFLPARGRAGSIPTVFGAPDDLVGGRMLTIPFPSPAPLNSDL